MKPLKPSERLISQLSIYVISFFFFFVFPLGWVTQNKISKMHQTFLLHLQNTKATHTKDLYFLDCLNTDEFKPCITTLLFECQFMSLFLFNHWVSLETFQYKLMHNMINYSISRTHTRVTTQPSPCFRRFNITVKMSNS